jgi:hypothetical protein
MSKKTKAEKIAAALRVQRLSLQTLSDADPTLKTTQSSRVNSPQDGMKSVKPQTHVAQDADVYDPRDLRKTLVVTLSVVALLTLVYVLQYKGYF